MIKRYIISSKGRNALDHNVEDLKKIGRITYVSDSTFGIEITSDRNAVLREYCRLHKLFKAVDAPLEFQ